MRDHKRFSLIQSGSSSRAGWHSPDEQIRSPRDLHSLKVGDSVANHHNGLIRELLADFGDGLRLALVLGCGFTHVKAYQASGFERLIIPLHDEREFKTLVLGW